MHAMVDIETMGIKRNCVVLTIGASLFDPLGIGPLYDFYTRVDIDQQISMGRTVDTSTVDWWNKQDKSVFNEAFDPTDRVGVEHAIQQLSDFLADADAVWSQGPTFDMIILEDLYAQISKKVPWRYSKVRDSRTLFAAMGDPRTGRVDAHNALADCHYQITGVQLCYKALRDAKSR